MKIKRVYHPYHLWEEIQYNMWGDVDNNSHALNQVKIFISDHKLYGSYMMRVISEWPISCENAFTDPNLNRKAWVGHSAVALALQIPEDITRKAWFYLEDYERLLANKEAERAIQAWERAYIKDKSLCKSMGEQMLFGWNSR